MARPSFRDRFFSERVAESIMSPLGILLAGAGTAAGILVGLPVVAAAGIGALAWGGRVLASVPRGSSSARVSPSSLSEPWRSYGVQAEEAKLRFDHVVASVAPGPLRERLELMSGRLDDGVDESWRIARRGHEIGNAIGKIDTVSAEAELADLRRRLGPDVPSPRRGRRSKPWTRSSHRPTASRLWPSRAATGCGSSTPASTSSSPAPSR